MKGKTPIGVVMMRTSLSICRYVWVRTCACTRVQVRVRVLCVFVCTCASVYAAKGATGYDGQDADWSDDDVKRVYLYTGMCGCARACSCEYLFVCACF